MVMMPVDRNVFPHASVRFAGVASAIATAVLAGCVSTSIQDVAPDAPKLPPAVVERLPQTAAVYFSDAFRAARPEHDVKFLDSTQMWRHVLGAASVDTFRQALAAVYSNVVELGEAPDATTMPEGASVLVIPQPPTVEGALYMTAVVTTYRQSVRYPVTRYFAGDTLPAQATIEGIAATGAHGMTFFSQKSLDESMMRSAGAALIASFSQNAIVGATNPSARFDTAALPNSNGVGVLRLDAGLARDDGIERRLVACLSHVVALPASLSGEQPGANLRDALFPWLDPGIAPADADGVRSLLERAPVRSRLAALGIGKLVFFEVRDLEPREKDNLYCAGGFNAAACVGVYESQTGYAVELAVWDIESHVPITMGPTNVLHTLGAVGQLFPVPYFTSNEAKVCTQMQTNLRHALER